MGLRGLLFLFVCSFSILAFDGGSLALGSDITVKTITMLDKTEPYVDAQLFHDGHLWVGRSRNGSELLYQVEVYSSDGTLLAKRRLSHTPSYLYPFGKGTALVVGKSAWPWKTHFTLVRYTGGRSGLQVQTRTFPEEIQADRFAGVPGRLFFTEPGDGGVFRLSARRWRDNPDIESPRRDLPGIHFLKPVLHGPAHSLLVGGSLFVIERNDMGPRRQNLARIDIARETVDRTFKDYLRDGLTDMVELPGNRLAVTEKGASQVLIVDARANRLVATLKAPQTPWGITRFGGKCIATLGEKSRTIRFYDFTRAAIPAVGEWDVSGPIDRFHRPRALAADSATGRLYVRSNDICPTCNVSFNKELLVEEKSGETFKRCR